MRAPGLFDPGIGRELIDWAWKKNRVTFRDLEHSPVSPSNNNWQALHQFHLVASFRPPFGRARPKLWEPESGLYFVERPRRRQVASPQKSRNPGSAGRYSRINARAKLAGFNGFHRSENLRGR